MWLLLALCSACCLGFYDIAKKRSLNQNAVIPVLTLNTVLSSLIFLPSIIGAYYGGIARPSSPFYLEIISWDKHGYIFIKSLIVLSSWIFGYYAIKHLPLTIVGPINATRPIMVLIGGLLIYAERLNVWQWIGVVLAGISFFLMSMTSRKEGISFSRNKWIYALVLAAFLGAVSGLYDNYLIHKRGFSPMAVISWFNLYQCLLMIIVLCIVWLPRRAAHPMKWRWSIIFISLFICLADFAYFYALSYDESLISVVSMIRRSSVLVSFGYGALFLREKNLRGKVFDLFLIIVSLLFLYFGS